MDIEEYTAKCASIITLQQQKKEEDASKMQMLEITQNEGFEILGKLYGLGVTTPEMNSVAFGDWKKPRHKEFEGRNKFSLYNCVNEGLKKSDSYTSISRHQKLHHYMVEGFDAELNHGLINQVGTMGLSNSGYKVYA